MVAPDIKKGSAALLVLAMLEDQPRHGYDIAQRLEAASDGALILNSATLYPTLHALERRGLVRGRWTAVAGERRRRYYSLTPAGHRALAKERGEWRDFVALLGRLARFERT
jgi:PadR family transcriptional regulator PadR